MWHAFNPIKSGKKQEKGRGGGGGRRANQDLTKAWKSYWKLILNNVHDLVLPDIGSYAAVSWLGDMGKTANSPLSEKFGGNNFRSHQNFSYDDFWFIQSGQSSAVSQGFRTPAEKTPP